MVVRQCRWCLRDPFTHTVYLQHRDIWMCTSSNYHKQHYSMKRNLSLEKKSLHFVLSLIVLKSQRWGLFFSGAPGLMTRMYFKGQHWLYVRPFLHVLASLMFCTRMSDATEHRRSSAESSSSLSLFFFFLFLVTCQTRLHWGLTGILKLEVNHAVTLFSIHCRL